MSELKLKGQLLKHYIIHTVIDNTVNKIKLLPNYQSLKINSQLIRTIMIEILIQLNNPEFNKNNKNIKIIETIDKSELVKQIYKELFFKDDELTEDITSFLETTIETFIESKNIKLKSNNVILKKVVKPIFNNVVKPAFDFFLKTQK